MSNYISKSMSLPSKSSKQEHGFTMFNLGSIAFREEYKVKYAYTVGAMYRGIASKEMVVRLGRGGMIGYLGTGGLPISEIKDNIQYIKQSLNKGEPYGVNFLFDPDGDKSMKLISYYLEAGVEFLEVAAFMQVTEALVWFRLKGVTQDTQGNIKEKNKILAKISRPEIAEIFMKPAPESFVNRLLEKGKITSKEAEFGKRIPLSNDICIEADSGGHTDRGIAMVLMPTIQRLKNEIGEKFNYSKPIRLGLAGGIGTPEAAAAAFILGADFILTGSINQCTVEAKMSNSVKNMLQNMNIQDTDHVPAGDMFEFGSKVQVLKKGLFFPARAKKLYQLYKQYNSLEEIPKKIKYQLEKQYFQKSFVEIWENVQVYFHRLDQGENIDIAEANPKHKMALTFRWYFHYCAELAFRGEEAQKVNYLIQTGPALGAFNQWVKGTSLANWTNRHVDEIGVKLMREAAVLLNSHLK